MITGDYDGDKAWACWDPRFVLPFVNADIKYLEEPAQVAKNFSKVNERVSEYLRRVRDAPASTRIREMQKFSLSQLRDTSLVGKYSNLHTNAIYKYGFAHEMTIELAWM